MSTQIAIQAPQGEKHHYTEDQIALIKRTVCVGASDDELKMFLGQCKRTGLDPFSRQIYSIKRYSSEGPKMVVHVGIDGLRLVADRTGRYMPGKSATFEVKGDEIISCTAYAKKMDSAGVWHDIEHQVFFKEYVAYKKDKNSITKTPTSMWCDKPRVMIAKCAESGLLRKAFPADLSGIYSPEEFNSDTATPETMPETIEVLVPEKKEPKKDISQFMILSFEAEALEKEILEKTEDGFLRSSLEHFANLDKRAIVSCGDLKNWQADKMRKWASQKPKKLKAIEEPEETVLEESELAF